MIFWLRSATPQPWRPEVQAAAAAIGDRSDKAIRSSCLHSVDVVARLIAALLPMQHTSHFDIAALCRPFFLALVDCRAARLFVVSRRSFVVVCAARL
jgi:hypothetical protein